MRRSLTILLLVLAFAAQSQTQIGFRMPRNVNKVEIPFEEINNLVVIPIIVNDFLKLKFILDTGVETAILTEPAFAPVLGVEFIRDIVISGAGIQDSIGARVAHNIKFELPGGVNARGMSMIVLENDYLRLSERMGMDIHGIIGNDLFSQFVVELDYSTKVVNLYRPDKFKPRKLWHGLNMDISGGKPFIHVQSGFSEDSIRLMIDSGASHAVLLDSKQTGVPIPEKTIPARLGAGLGGEIQGILGRLDKISIAGYDFHSVLVSIPYHDSYSQLIKRGSRLGTIGGEILGRLDPIFDYQRNRVYFSKNGEFRRQFEADMTGIDLIVKGRFLDTLMIDYITHGSPADKIGLKAGDQVVSINAHTLGTNSFGQIQSLLKGRNGKKLKFKIIREGRRERYILRLKRQI